MPRNETIVARKDNLFDSYIRNSTTALTGPVTPPIPLVPPWQRLLLSAAEYAQWLSFRDQWIVVYAKYTDKAQRTISIKNQKNTLKKEFITFTQILLTRMAGSGALTADERLTFNLKERDRTLTPRLAIDTSPSVLLRAKEGRRVQVECRVIADSSRPSKHPLCDVVAYRYTVAALPAAPVSGTGGGGGTTPTPVVAALTTGESGKAKFILQLEQADAGKQLTIECCWKNSKENHKSGPWSAAVNLMIIW